MRYTEKKFFVVSCFDFESAVFAAFGREYNFVASEEVSNDTVHAFRGITGNFPCKSDADAVQEFINGDEPLLVGRILLNELVRLGVCPPGDYLVTVSW